MIAHDGNHVVRGSFCYSPWFHNLTVTLTLPTLYYSVFLLFSYTGLYSKHPKGVMSLNEYHDIIILISNNLIK